MASLRLAADLQLDSIVDGPGIRMVLWTQGCGHHCRGCHNPHTHDVKGGILIQTDELIRKISEAKLQTGLTLSGGEPFLQSMELVPIVKEAKNLNLNIWAYSGFYYEQLVENIHHRQLLTYIDVLVDGPFREDEQDYRLRFKGSRNQRIIDVQKSIEAKKIIYSAYDEMNQNIEKGIE